MEGLIPMVFRAMKKNRTRRQYHCLSSGAAQTYDIADFYINGQTNVYGIPSTEQFGGFCATERSAHRRHSSMGDYTTGFSSRDDRNITYGASPPPPRKQLVRFRSHRMFSCITGA